jgi:hypothetical protein
MSEISRRGRILRAIERAFIASRRSEVSTSEIMQFAFALPLYRGRHSAQDRRLFSRSILRAAPRLCDRVGKAKSRGAPWLWRLREPDVALREVVWRTAEAGRMEKPSRI